MSIGLKSKTVRLEPHQDEWEAEGRQICRKIREILDKDLVDVQHVGSTSIRGIHAKPIIDVAVAVRDLQDIRKHDEELAQAGIVYRKEDYPGQLLYRCGDFENEIITHFIHVVLYGSPQWHNYLNFRDYLNTFEAEAKVYEKCKLNLWEQHPNDRDAYVTGKAALVTELLQKAAEWRNGIIGLFTKERAAAFQTNFRTLCYGGKTDFREVILITETEIGGKLVIKLAENAFTTPESILMWQRCIEEYRNMGCYCPRILPALSGDYPYIDYKGHRCIAFAEEYSRYGSAEDSEEVGEDQERNLRDALYILTAKIAAKKFDYTDQPSGYTLFDLYPGDERDEVTENALAFREYCQTLPETFKEQAERMFQRWEENRSRLKEIYHKLPFSVFQADFNMTNVLVDENGRFEGLMDFNLAGRDELLNYLFREIFPPTFDEEVAEILRALKIVSEYYSFSEEEIQAAPLIYRCVKPLWFCPVYRLKEAGSDPEAIQKCLDEMEYAQMREIDFESVMRRPIPETDR